MIVINTFLIIGCSQDMPSQVEADMVTLQKKPVRTITTFEAIQDEAESKYPLSRSTTSYYFANRDLYKGTGIMLSDGSSFYFNNGDLTAPDYWPAGENITITMTVEKDQINNELIFSFSPSGCKFDAPAEVWFYWGEIGEPVPELYYIDQNGELIETYPDNINISGKSMCLFIDHFSRYAVAYSD